MGYELTSLVYLKPTVNNGFKEDTWVDCNKYFEFTVEEFENITTSGKMEFKGEVSDTDYEQILIGLHSSREIETEVKEKFPDPNNF